VSGAAWYSITCIQRPSRTVLCSWSVYMLYKALDSALWAERWCFIGCSPSKIGMLARASV